jgi:hypothetical protein
MLVVVCKNQTVTKLLVLKPQNFGGLRKKLMKYLNMKLQTKKSFLFPPIQHITLSAYTLNKVHVFLLAMESKLRETLRLKKKNPPKLG